MIAIWLSIFYRGVVFEWADRGLCISPSNNNAICSVGHDVKRPERPLGMETGRHYCNKKVNAMLRYWQMYEQFFLPLITRLYNGGDPSAWNRFQIKPEISRNYHFIILHLDDMIANDKNADASYFFKWWSKSVSFLKKKKREKISIHEILLLFVTLFFPGERLKFVSSAGNEQRRTRVCRLIPAKPEARLRDSGIWLVRGHGY